MYKYEKRQSKVHDWFLRFFQEPTQAKITRKFRTSLEQTHAS